MPIRRRARITKGRVILFDGRDLLGFSDEEMRQVRGRDIGMVFQEPMTSLNPVLTDRPADHRNAAAASGRGSRPRPARRAIELLGLVGIADPSAGWASIRINFRAACASAS